ncbi:hypothetical protein R8O05_23490 [Vibrio sp. 1865]|uniref:hypothetical protein n=1 Tax=unclassified Vibrio TaxID=2614977 RepID=UPI002963E172|nr:MULTISPECIES: hypothetical protein [unclassified Vibrio]MDW2094521.1 hypothetical protein [Vibrio sp. 1866]MDW3104299.1 hypothetical protein [Vibrio sp. 1874]MDW3202280.1 hypothetical protein [Vibrio sp. 1865]
MNHEFYEHLIESDEFCLYLGRLTLLVSKLESRLKEIIIASEVKVRIKLDKPTLGPLIGCCKEHQLVNKDIVFLLGYILERRNYVVHNLYPLFDGKIEPTLLPNDNLVSEDAEYLFAKCVRELSEEVKETLKMLNT